MLHAFYGIGALIGPLFLAWLLSKGLSISTIFVYLGIIFSTIFLIYLIVLRCNTSKHLLKNQPKGKKYIVPFIKNKDFLLVCFCAFLFAGLSIGLSTWMSLYMQKEFNSSVILSSLPITSLWIGVIIGRFISSFLSVRINMMKWIIFNCIIGALLWIVGIIINSPILIVVICGLLGFTISGILPSLITISCNWYKKSTGTASSLVFLFFTIGYMILPWLFGFFADFVSLRFCISAFCLFPFLISLCFYKLYRNNQIKKES